MKALPLVMVTVSSVAALAQTDERLTQERQDRPIGATHGADYVLLKDVIGAKVAFEPGAEARREAAADNESAKRPTGEIKELIVENNTGNLEVAVVSFGGVLGLGDKTVALPVRLFTWNAANERFDLKANEDQLKGLPAFDLKEARKRGLDTEMTVIRSGWTNLEGSAAEHGTVRRDASAPRDREQRKDEQTGANRDPAGTRREGEVGTKHGDERTAKGEAERRDTDQDAPQKGTEQPQGTVVSGTKFVTVPNRYVCATDIDDYPVYALSEKLGKVENCVIDRSSRRIAYCIVSHGGALGIGETEYLLPYRGLILCRDGDSQIYCVNRTTEQIKNGVKYEKPKDGVLDPDAARRAEEGLTSGR